jgi:hypothetical protein
MRRMKPKTSMQIIMGDCHCFSWYDHKLNGSKKSAIPAVRISMPMRSTSMQNFLMEDALQSIFLGSITPSFFALWSFHKKRMARGVTTMGMIIPNGEGTKLVEGPQSGCSRSEHSLLIAPCETPPEC